MWKKLISSLILVVTLLASNGAAFAKNGVTPAQTISPVQFLSGDEAVGPAAFNQEQPNISRGGDQYLVAWTDFRTGGSSLISDESSADIYAARLDASGSLIDTTPIPLTLAAGNQLLPQVSWNGTNWLVIWLSQTPTQFFWSYEVQGVRVSPTGQVLDPAPITIYKYPSSTDAEATLTSDGSNWVIVTRGAQAGESDVIGVRVAADGTVLDPAGVVLVPGTFSLTFNLDVAFAVDEYMLTYIFNGDVFFLRLDTNLVAKDANPIRITSTNLISEDTPRVASNGTDFFVIWDRFVSTTQFGEARGTRITYAGQVLDPGGLSLSGQVFLGTVAPRVVWDGVNWMTTFKLTLFGNDPDELRAARVTPSGAILDPGGVVVEPVATFYDQPEITQGVSNGVQVVWKDNRAGGPFPDDVSTFNLPDNLVPGSPAGVSFSAPSQTQASAATDGSGYLVVFSSNVSGQNRIKAQLLDSAGNSLLPEPLQLASGPDLVDPKVAWNGSLYLAVWSDVPLDLNASVVYAQRIAADGTLIDPAPFAVMEGFMPDVAAAGDVFLLVAIQQTTSIQFREPFGTRVRGSDGAILDPTPIPLGVSFAGHPVVTGLGTRWLVSYQRNFSHDDAHADIYATFVESTGSAGATFPVASSLNPFFYDPAISSDGTNALVIWQDSGLGDINGARVLGNGTVLPVFAVSSAPEGQDNPALAWDGMQYVSLYEDLRNITFFVDLRTDIYSTRIDSSGGLIDPDGFAVFNDPIPEKDPAVTGSGGISLLAGSVFRDLAPYMSYRLGVRLLGETGCTVNCLRVTAIQMRLTATAVQARITIKDENGLAVSGATVTATWQLPDGTTQTASRRTGATGVANFRLLDSRTGTFTITVTNIVKTGYTFDPINSTILTKSITR